MRSRPSPRGPRRATPGRRAWPTTGNDFVMYYTATEASTGDQCIGVATAALADRSLHRPLGPARRLPERRRYRPDRRCRGLWRQHRPRHLHGSRRQLLPDLEERREPHRCTDRHLVRAADDRPSSGRSGPRPSSCADDAAWQSGIVEGPDMVETQTINGGTTTNTYYLFYSGSDEGASTYAIGWASCPGGQPRPAPRVDERAAARHVPGHVGARRPRRVPSAAGSGNYVMAFAAWQGIDHRLPRAAASGPCTWPT